MLATDWNENVRAAAVTQLANAAKCDDDVAVGALVEALKVALLPSHLRCSSASACAGSLMRCMLATGSHRNGSGERQKQLGAHDGTR